MKRFEFDIIFWNQAVDGGEDRLLKKLNDRGHNGWRVICIRHNLCNIAVYLEREVRWP